MLDFLSGLVFIITFFTLLIVKWCVGFLRLVRTGNHFRYPHPSSPHFTAQCEDASLAMLW